MQGVTEDRYGIGYSGIGYQTSGVKAVPLAETDKGAVLGRQLRRRAERQVSALALPLHLRQQGAGRPLDPLTAEFVKLMYSKEGQEAVVKDGYMPLPANMRRRSSPKS